MNTNQPNSDNPLPKPSTQVPASIEPWQITAYALGELDPAARAEVESWILKNPSAAAEVQSIRDTATQIQKQLATSSLNGGLDSRRSEQVLQEITGRNTGTATVQLRKSRDEEVRMKRFRRFRTMGLIASGIAASLVAFRLSPWYSDRGYSDRVEIVAGTKTGYNIPARTEGDRTESFSYNPKVLRDSAELELLLDRESSVNNKEEVFKQTAPADNSGYVASGGNSGEVSAIVPLDSAEATDNRPAGPTAAGSVAGSNGTVPNFRSYNDGSNLGGQDVVTGQEGVAANWSDTNKSLSPLDVTESVTESEQSSRRSISLAAEPSQTLKDRSIASSAAPSEPQDSKGGLRMNTDSYEFRSKYLRGGFSKESEAKEQGDRLADRTGLNSLAKGMGGGGMGGMGGGMSAPSGGLGLAGPASGERGLQKRASDRGESQFPDELKANVPSLRRASENASGDRFEPIVETPFAEVTQSPQSTFSIDVDTASYSKLRQYVSGNVVPNPAAVRIEEMINYFDYNYPGPTDGSPFAAHMKMAICPWNTEHRLVRVAIQAKKVNAEQRPASNLVFLIDVSGSMAQENKLPLVKRTLALLASQLREQDRVAIVVYAGAAGCVLPSTSGVSKDRIMASIDELQSGGSTNGGQGIELAYRIAKENYVDGGVNRVILCTDGDFNVGVTGTDQLVSMMQENAKSNVFLTCLGYGIGNYNDSMMEQISNKGNGTYGMVDSEMEARKIMVEQLSGTLMTVAKDVKIQIEFNPQKVASYRLIGYENRRLAAQDFDNDKKDAGEIGAGHRVTALYEIVPVGKEGAGVPGGELRYGKKQPEAPTKPAADAEQSGELANEWMLLKIRAKQPEATESTKQEFVLKEGDLAEETYSGERADMDWAVSVAEFGLLLRHSKLAPGIDWDRMVSRAQESVGDDSYRRECLAIMQQAKRMFGK